jgi:hypothetical protein
MTQAFNLAQLANNLNTSGQLDGTDGLSGLVANANLASTGSASSSTYLRGDRSWASLPSQKVIQVQSLMLTTYTSNGNFSSDATSGYQDISGYSLAITPTSSTSKILVQIHTWGSSQRIWYRVLRNSTMIGVGDAIAGVNQQAGMYNWQIQGLPIAYQWMDSPNTTSSTTYKLQIGGESNITAAFTGAAQNNSTQGSGPVNQYPPLVRTMLLWEISA